MVKCQESKIEFDFAAAIQVYKHDVDCNCQGAYSNDQNSLWPGVDFRTQDHHGWIWLEVKNWRISAKNIYARKMNDKAFALELREKFLGTAAYLAWKGLSGSAPNDLTLIFLFEPPHAADPALKGVIQEQLRNKLHSGLNALNIRWAVMDLDTWNRRFGIYQARPI